jgi:phosphatidate cytidylyltransferase
MDQDRGMDPDEERGETPEGVRIIGAEEAAEALERPDVAHRRTGGQLRYGDRPPSPPAHGPRPVLRFPLGASADPTEVERPPVAPSSPPSEQIELPHWTEPPTGQVPAAVTGEQPVVDDPGFDEGDEGDDWAGFAPAPRWRDEVGRDDDDEDLRVFGDDSMRIGALDESDRISHEDYFSFADLDEHVTPGRSVFADLPEEDDARLWEPEPFDPRPFDPEPQGGYRQPEAWQPETSEPERYEAGRYEDEGYGTELDEPEAYVAGEGDTGRDQREAHEPEPYQPEVAGGERWGAEFDEFEQFDDQAEPGELQQFDDQAEPGESQRFDDQAEPGELQRFDEQAEPGELEQFEEFDHEAQLEYGYEGDYDDGEDDVDADGTRGGAIWDDELDGFEDEEPEQAFLADDEPEEGRRRPEREPRGARRAPARRSRSGGGGSDDRDMGTAVVVGVALLGLALLLFNIGPSAAMILVAAVIGFAAAELFSVLRRAGYQPATLAGIVGTVGLAVGAYNYGTAAIPLVLFLTTVVCLLWYLVGASTEAPLVNVGVTLAGVLWVGLFGSFAALLLSPQAGPALAAAGVAGVVDDPGIGILLAAIFGTVGYDVGGLFVGRNAGRTPLSAVSPNKTREGLLGGMLVAWVVVVVGAALIGWGSIDSLGEGAIVGLAVAIAAPLGDLVESLIKRDLAVKDMGSILPGHGGVLDRVDAMLFVLPTVYLVGSVANFYV